MRNPNNKDDLETRATLRALRRAARRALELGIRTGTPVFVIKNHRIVDLTKETVPDEARVNSRRVRQ